eukprot:6168635-Pyramimonas_sp.AAC.1
MVTVASTGGNLADALRMRMTGASRRREEVIHKLAPRSRLLHGPRRSRDKSPRQTLRWDSQT